MAAIMIGLEKALDNEKPTIQKLASLLSDEWSVVIPARRVGHEGDVVLVKNDQLAFIEIKNSNIEYRKGGFEQQNRRTSKWVKIDPIGQMDNVFTNLMKYKKDMFEIKRYIHENYFLCTPDSHDAGIPKEIGDKLSQIHRENFNENLESFITKNCKKVEIPFTDREIQNIIKTITPDGDLISIIKSKENGVQSRLVECTEEQKRVLDGFRSLNKFSILGGAGTGKTVLAVNSIKKKLQNDNSKKYIFACYTRRLYRDYLSRTLPKTVLSETIASLLDVIANKLFNIIEIDYKDFKNYVNNIKEKETFDKYFEANYTKEFEAFVLSMMIEPTKLFNDMKLYLENEHSIEITKIAEELINSLEKDSDENVIAKVILDTITKNNISQDNIKLNKLNFDGLYCDEGQDISPPWFLFFSNFITPENYELFIFYDLNQKVLGKSEFKMPIEMFEYDLNSTGNCRSTDQISIFANLVLGEKNELRLRNIYGDNVRIASNKNLEFLCKSIENEITKLLTGGVKETDIAILYDSSTSELAKNVNSYFDKKYLYLQKDKRDSTGNIDSIRRFKGLEKKYVFLLVESSYFNENKKLIYVGATRATTQLHCMVFVNDNFNISELKDKYGEELSRLIGV